MSLLLLTRRAPEDNDRGIDYTGKVEATRCKIHRRFVNDLECQVVAANGSVEDCLVV
jgi:hypothetical protein